MSDKQQEQAFLTKVRQTLDDNAQGMDEFSVARLRAARHRALSAKPSRPLWPLPAAVASALIAGVMVWQLSDPGMPGMVAEVEDMELLMSEEGIEFYEDIEFYQWLAFNENAG